MIIERDCLLLKRRIRVILYCLLGGWAVNLALVDKSLAQEQSRAGEAQLSKNWQEINEIEIVGNTVFNDLELKQAISYEQGERVSVERLIEMQQEIAQYYIEQGYLNSRSVLVPQKLQGGVARIQIIEQTLESIQIKGAKELSSQYLKSQLPSEGEPLNVYQLISSLKRLENQPLIDKIHGEIMQNQQGKNILVVELEERNPFGLSLNLNNAYAPSIGSFGRIATLSHLNLLGGRERATLALSQTEGLTRWAGSYSIPLNRQEGRIGFEINNANSQIIEEEIADFEIKADFLGLALSFNQPLAVSQTGELNLGIVLEFIDSETFVLEDFSFSFVEGLEDGRNRMTTLAFVQEYTQRGGSSLFLVRSQFTVGLDIFEATKNNQGADSIFWNWQGSLQWLRALNQEVAIVMGANFQLTPDQLLPLAQIAIGGKGSVRGYRRNLAVGDNGLVGTMELRWALIESAKGGKISLIPFMDIGTVWNNNRETTGSSTFFSSGLALRYQVGNFEARIDYAIPLVETSGYGATNTEDNIILSLGFNNF